MLIQETWYNSLKNKKSEVLYEKLSKLYTKNNDYNLLNEAISLDDMLKPLRDIVKSSRDIPGKVISMKNNLDQLIPSRNFNIFKGTDINSPNFQIAKEFENLRTWFKTAEDAKTQKWIVEYEKALNDPNLSADKLRQFRSDPEGAIAGRQPSAPAPSAPAPSAPQPPVSPPPPPRSNLQVVNDWISSNTRTLTNIANNAIDENAYFEQVTTLLTESGILNGRSVADVRKLMESAINASGETGIRFQRTVSQEVKLGVTENISRGLAEDLTDTFANRNSWLRKFQRGTIFVGIALAIGIPAGFTINYLIKWFGDDEIFYKKQKCRDSAKWKFSPLDSYLCGWVHSKEENQGKSWNVIDDVAEPRSKFIIGEEVQYKSDPANGCYKVVSITGSDMTLEAPSGEKFPANADEYEKCTIPITNKKTKR